MCSSQYLEVGQADISGDGSFWKVQLDVRDLGGHLDFTRRARALFLDGLGRL